jgi:putative phosphoribosyl transferase
MPDVTPRFADRRDAGRQLAERLLRYRPLETTVLVLPRGGVPVGFEVAQTLAAPLDLLLVRKLAAPGHPEFGIGAVIDGEEPHRVLNDNWVGPTGADIEYLEFETRRQCAEVERRRRRYLGDRRPLSLQGRIAIVVDDGMATGATMLAALRGLADRDPGRIVLALPVAAPEPLAALADAADDIVCLHAPENFQAVSRHYADFSETADAEVIALLREAERRVSPAASAGSRRQRG